MARIELVEREPEIRALAGWLEQAVSGEPRLVWCSGEAGIGKTRLAQELVAMARSRQVPALWGRAAEADGAPPYWPWRSVLDQAAALPGRPDPPPLLATVAGGPAAGGEGGPSVAGGPEERFRLFDAVTRYLRACAGPTGLVVVLDDLHWADPASIALLQHLTRELGDSPLLVFATSRGAAPMPTERLDLAGLGPAGVGRALELISGRRPSPAAVARVHELTGGNPFFVGELAPTADGGDVPVTVRGAIRARMDRLSPLGREALEAAAIVGREFPVAVVAAVLDRPVLACLDAFDEAAAAGLVVPGEHRFTHVLIRDAIEAQLSSVEKVQRHRVAAEAIERLYAADLSSHLADLARHWAVAARAGHETVAANWSRRAADEAMRRLSYEDAARLYRQALAVGGPGLADDARARLLLGVARALHRSAEVSEAFRACREAAEAARRTGRPELLAEAALVVEPVGVAEWDDLLRGLSAEALAALPAGNPALRARLLARSVQTGMHLDGRDELSRAALAAAEESGDDTALAVALGARHLVCSGPDGLPEREALAARLLAAGRRRADPATLATAYGWRVDALFARGDLAGAAAEIENLRWPVQQSGGPTARWLLLRYEATLAQARGEFAAARRRADAAFDAIAPMRHPAAFPVRMALLVTVDHHCGADPSAPHVQACRQTGPGTDATPGHAFRIMDYLGPALVLLEAGYAAEAAAKFRALGPVDGWLVPPFHQLIMYAFGMIVAIRIGDAPAVRALRDRLEPVRDQHCVSGAAVEHYVGPVTLHLGTAAAFLGELDRAARDLSGAVAACERIGAAPHLVEARYELARVLIRQGRPAAARPLVRAALSAARKLGMTPFAAALSTLDVAPADPLTARERQVAVLVAKGRTNREIAAELVLSERTAQNHVQHVLTKLGFANRSQIATWVAAEMSTAGE